MTDIWSNARTAGGKDVAKYGQDSKPTDNRDLGTMLIPTQKENTMYTDRTGQTHGLSAIEVVSLDTRVTDAFAKKGVVPNPTLRKRAVELIRTYPTLKADEAVKIVLNGGRAPSTFMDEFHTKW